MYSFRAGYGLVVRLLVFSRTHKAWDQSLLLHSLWSHGDSNCLTVSRLLI